MARTLTRAFPAIAACAALALGTGACGSSSGGGTTAGSDDGAGGAPGGTLTILTSQDAQSLDPGVTYSSLDLNVLSATVRTLYTYKPDDPATRTFALAFISITPATSPEACMRLMLGMNASITEVRNRFTTCARIAATEKAAKLCRLKSVAATHWSVWPRRP